MLTVAEGAFQVGDANALDATVNDLLGDRNRAQRVGQNAHDIFNANKGAVAKTMAIIISRMVSEPGRQGGTATDLPQGI